MRRKSRPFKELLLERLGNPEIAKHYLNEAYDESQQSFLKALRVVAQAREMATVAKEAGLQRESLYRVLSEIGNPTLESLIGVLKAVGIRIRFDTYKAGVSGDSSEKEVIGNQAGGGCIEKLSTTSQASECSHERMLNALLLQGYFNKDFAQENPYPDTRVPGVEYQEMYGN